MFTINNFDYDCTKKCKLTEHGQKITLALTKRAIPPEKLAAYISKICKNFAEIKDDLGRSALHVASSVDKYSIVEWLLNNGALINAKDLESGSNALHRAIYYGCIDCAVLLLRYGANLELIDNDTLVPLQYVCKFGDYHENAQRNNELLVWGTNKNYNLGIGNEQGSLSPQFVDFFRKDYMSIETLAISSFHSLFVDKKGNLYSVGHGKGGRLGIGSENSLPSPKKIKVPIKNLDEKIIQISVSKNHSMLLTNKSTVFVCGSNEHQQLGLKPPPDNLLVFKEIPHFHQCGIENLFGIIAKDFHSIAYSHQDIYLWGKNNGQFGLNNTIDYITLPKQIIADNYKIQCVESTNFAMAITTTGNHIFLYYNYKMKLIKPPLLEAIKSISLIADDPQKLSTKESTLKLLLLTDTNVVYIWYDNIQQYLRCSLALHRITEIDKLIFKQNQIILLSKGDIYSGKCLKVPVSQVVADSLNAWQSSTYQNKNDIFNDQKIRIELKRIANIDRAIDIFVDDEFESFAVLQENSRKYFIIPGLMPEKYTFKSLLNDVSDADTVHDIIFHVDNEIFCAHKFIVFSRSKGLKTIVEKFQDKDIYLNFKNLTGKLFELILKYIYTNYFLTYDDIDDIHQSFGPDYCGERKDVCRICLDVAEKFNLKDLEMNLKSLLGQTPSKYLDKCRFNRLKRSTFPELYDVVIKCANNLEILAHKCILVTRLEYFNLMFTHDWAETTKISLTTIPIEYLEPIIDFLYTSDVDAFRKENYTESFLYNMIVICDQFFINRLRKVCEILLMEKISIRKCGEILQFACSYNCAILKRGCLEYICQNLSRILLQRSLETCDPDVLNCINEHYRQMFKKVFDFRMITPDADAVEDEVLLSFVQDFHVDLDYRMEEENNDKNKSKLKFKESKSQLSKRNYEKNAISVLKELSVVDEKSNQMKINANKSLNLVKEITELNEKILNDSVSWMKVVDKKDGKKKISTIVAAVNVNSIINQEEKQKEAFINLNEIVKSGDKFKSENKGIVEEQSISGRISLNIGDFTPLKGGKLSQKERKRLSSETKVEPKSPTTPTNPIPIPSKTNAWGNISSSVENQHSLADIMKSPDEIFSISPEKSSINNSGLIKSFDKNKLFTVNSTTLPSSSGAVTKKLEPSSFSKIVEEEKQQKDYYEKLRSKSLVLTQIEEAAITELQQFYNVENCEDEVITIERKSYPITRNFAIWQKN